MGNRAVIEFENTGIGIYLHWNGGRESVEAFLKAGIDLGLRSGDDYGPARLCQIIGNWFGGVNSLGVGKVEDLDCDNGDNGMYLVDKRWKIVGRSYCPVHHDLHKYDTEKTKDIYDEVMAINSDFFQSV